MGRLSIKHENFIKNYLETGEVTKSYVAAGYAETGASPSASRLLKDARIQRRIAEVQAELVDRTNISLEKMVEELISDREAARADANHNAAIKANIEIAKLHGLYEVDNVQKSSPFDSMSMSELLAMAKEKIAILESDVN